MKYEYIFKLGFRLFGWLFFYKTVKKYDMSGAVEFLSSYYTEPLSPQNNRQLRKVIDAGPNPKTFKIGRYKRARLLIKLTNALNT